jgi:hypothetical protein
VARCTVAPRVTCVRSTGGRWAPKPTRFCKRYIVDSEARYVPSSASRGTNCLGGRCPYCGLVMTARTCFSSASVSAFPGRHRGPHRRSSPPGRSLQRSIVRAEIPMLRHAAWSRAPVHWASSSAVSITARCLRPYRRPRPPTVGSLFFEYQQRRRLGERLLFPCELALERSHPPGRRQRRSSLLRQGEAPLLVVGQPQSLAV